MSPPTPVLIGHRGAPGRRPEHTRASYELAFAFGMDAVEPDVVFSRDGVLVVRHENEIGGTTDVADHPEFASRHTTKVVDGSVVSGWFTEDFTWDELRTLRCRERLPELRPGSAAFDGQEPPLCLGEVLALAAKHRRGVVLEIKHATYFAGLGFDVAGAVATQIEAAGWAHSAALTLESFEPTVLRELAARGITATSVFLLEATGTPYDLRAAGGASAPDYASFTQPAGLDAIAAEFDGISVDKRMLVSAPHAGSSLVDAAHARGLVVFTWTCRPENMFLAPEFRRGSSPASFGDYAGEWALIAASGVDGIFVDFPDLGSAVFR